MSLRSQIKSNQLLFGTLITLSSLEVAEILARAGFDWFFIDMEHSSLGVREAQAVLQAVSGQVECLLRIPLNDEIWMKKALDTGAAGVIVPQVNTADEATRVVRWAKYPPRGRRSVGLARAQAYGAGLEEAIRRADEETAIVIQIETVEAVSNISSLLEVDGIDAVLIGPYDLSASMGRIGEVDHPEVQEAIRRV